MPPRRSPSPAERSLAEEEHPFEALGLEGEHEPLREGVAVRRLPGREGDFHARGLQDALKCAVDLVSRSRIICSGVRRLRFLMVVFVAVDRRVVLHRSSFHRPGAGKMEGSDHPEVSP
jgi:hypothetical protein